MKEIVTYDNRLNELRFPELKEQEMNIFCNLLYHLKDKETQIIKFTASEISNFFGSAYNNKLLAFMLKNMADRMRQRGFEYITHNDNRTSYNYITMFPTFKINTIKNPKAIDHLDAEILESLEVRINPDFSYLINKLNSNFTQFELVEFMSISGKYTKRLYMLLKQFKHTGLLKLDFEEFRRRLDIPTKYRISEIDKEILKSAVKELSEEKNLFNMPRTPFKNLKYEKIKGRGRGRGGIVVGIEFTFDKETNETNENNKFKEDKPEIQAIQPTEHIEPNLNSYNNKLISTEFGKARILSVEKHDNKLKVAYNLTKNGEIRYDFFNSIAELEEVIQYPEANNQTINLESINNLMIKI
ncbi:MAG: replication initiation protein [Campylobacter sp.]|nr:replication initiation protein [Campylobacter sp.]MBR2849171.1 replication initiation protein [Mycoplasmataceae bacterium]MBR4097600.1 replication initiation protein [Campylobacter sp.]MBR4097605.1 replication initiation protein [Campylobacter sp.]MBR6612373.1 replication initiation protein [Campylobacter sp.]